MRRVVRLFVGGIVFMSVFASVTVLLSSEASAAGLAGTWVSRIDGQGYTQSYLYFGGATITESFDTELDLSVSGSSVTGTWTVYQASGPTTVNVDGTFDGYTFLMNAYLGWDGVSYMVGEYALTVDGSSMTGTGSYLNVGVTIHGSFDLVRGSGLLGLGDLAAPLAVAGGIGGAVGAVAFVIPSPKPGMRPSAGRSGYVPPQPVPSDVRETYAGPIGPPEAAQPQGGVGMTWGSSDPTVWKGQGPPPAPKDWYSSISQQPPQCPNHPGTFTTPHYSGPTDAGSWYCPHCNGYPWGRKV